eukprot:COSAG02_NODE_735_length_17872_cov_20.966860_4_plen_175_part_00
MFSTTPVSAHPFPRARSGPVLHVRTRCRSGLEMMALRAALCLAIVVAHVVEPPTRVELMAAGANRVCLRAGQPERDPSPKAPPPAPPAKPNIVQLADSVPDLSTLVEALKAGNLTSALSSPGPFTVFAPTNEAFSALPPTVLKSLLDPENILHAWTEADRQMDDPGGVGAHSGS